MSNKEDYTEFVRKLAKNVWEKRDYNNLGDYYNPDLVAFINEKKMDFNGLKEGTINCYNTYFDPRIEIEEMVFVDNKLALKYKQHLQFKESKKRIILDCLSISYLKNNKIYKIWIKANKIDVTN